MDRAWVLLVGLAVGLTGCVGSKAEKGQNRAQIGGEDAAPDADAFATVGMKTLPDNMGPVAVSGVGLVYKLRPGTGSAAPPGTWRQMLEQSLKKQGFSHLKDLLEDPNRTTSLVLVSAVIPPGARKGELTDVQISLPDDSRTTSLKGGVLLACDLFEYDTTGNLDSIKTKGRPAGPSGSLLLGSVWAKAEGPVVAGAVVKEDDDRRASAIEPPDLKAGRIWGGARITQTRPYYFLLQPGSQNVRMAAQVAERLNATFQGNADPDHKVAEFRTRELVVVNVPFAYRNNHHRFLLVARQVPIVPVSADGAYRRQLEDELLSPATALTAAIKLEALGGDTRRALRVGLESPSPWVRFAAAESLAYLGYTDGAPELAKLAADHPGLRAYCLKALAATDDAAFTDRLAELMAGSDPVLRYGAFLALRLANEDNPAAGGQLFNQTLWVHRVAPGSPGMIHLTTAGRSEVVLFGDGVKLRGPFAPLPVGADFTVSMAGEDEVKVTRVVQVNGSPEVKEQRCPADLHAVLAAMAKLGGRHAEAVDLLRRADTAQLLTAALVVDAIPRQMSVQQLAALAKNDPALVKADVEVARVGTDRIDLEKAGVDLASGHDADGKAEPAAPRPPLSQRPGRIFGPKPPPEPAPVGEPLTPVVPASAETTPPEPTPVNAERSRNPGRLFPRK